MAGSPDQDPAVELERRASELEARIRREGLVVTIAGEVTSAVAARVLGVSEGTLRNWRTAENGPRYVRRNGRVWYPVAALVEFLS